MTSVLKDMHVIGLLLYVRFIFLVYFISFYVSCGPEYYVYVYNLENGFRKS